MRLGVIFATEYVSLHHRNQIKTLCIKEKKICQRVDATIPTDHNETEKRCKAEYISELSSDLLLVSFILLSLLLLQLPD